jgi:hypothetical protein
MIPITNYLQILGNALALRMEWTVVFCKIHKVHSSYLTVIAGEKFRRFRIGGAKRSPKRSENYS